MKLQSIGGFVPNSMKPYWESHKQVLCTDKVNEQGIEIVEEYDNFFCLPCFWIAANICTILSLGWVLWINFFKESTFAPKSKPLIDQGFCFQFFQVWLSSTRGMTQIWQLEASQQSRSTMFFFRIPLCSSNLQELVI